MIKKNCFKNFINKNKKINYYLSKNDILSLSWLSLYTITIILIIFQVFNLHNQMYKEADNIKQNLNNTCIIIESLSSELSDIPENINKITINNINFILSSIKSGLISSVDIIENVTLWFINNYKNTLKCLLLLAVNGGINLVENGSHIFEENANEALSSFQMQINNINNDLSNIQSKINSIPFANIQLPYIPEININNITIPKDFYSSLENINNSFPEILLTVDNYLIMPFDILKSKINDTNFSFENNINLSSNTNFNFCQEKVLEINTEIINWINKLFNYSIIILIIFIFLMTLVNIIYINYKYKIYITNINKIVEKNYTITLKNNIIYILDFINNSIINKVIIYFNLIIPKKDHKLIIKWFLNYIFYEPVAICFLIAISGIFFTYIQIGLIKALKYNIVNNLIMLIDNLINNINKNNYVEIINKNINITETNINNNLFGWVDITTTTLNNTLNDVINEITNFIDKTFQNTPLINPIQDVINCLILIKIEGIQKALTWIKEKSQINLPYLDISTISINKYLILKLLSPIIGKQNVNNNTIEINDGLLINIFDNYELYLIKSLNIYLTLLIIWCIVLSMGIIKIIYKTQK